jgi:hypothetical protein
LIRAGEKGKSVMYSAKLNEPMIMIAKSQCNAMARPEYRRLVE